MSKVIIKKYSPSAVQILNAAQRILTTPGAELVVQEKPEQGAEVLGGVSYSGRRYQDYDRSLAYLKDLTKRHQMKNQVFLGGACAPTTWRKDIAIPMLKEAGCDYFDPVVTDWDESCVAREAEAKLESYVLLFVFDPAVRALASLIEAMEFMHAGRQKVVLVSGYMQQDTEIAGQTLQGMETMDINRARNDLFQFATAKGVPVLRNVKGAVVECIRLIRDAGRDYEVSG